MQNSKIQFKIQKFRSFPFTLNFSLLTFHFWRSQGGQSLIELLIAVGLSAILIPALFAGFATSREGRAQEPQRLEATGLLREAEEAVRSVRERSWTNIATNDTYHPEISGGGDQWNLVSGPETTPTGYTRQTVISDAQRDSAGKILETGGTVDLSTKKVTTTVSWTTPYASSVQSTNYYQRYLGNNAFTDASDTDFAGGAFTNTEISGTGQAADVRLTQSAGAGGEYGNKFILTTNCPTTPTSAVCAIGNMTFSTHKTSLRFSAQKTGTVNSIRVYLHSEAGISPAYRYGIQTNNPIGNIPSGSWVGNFGTLTATSTGWKTITLGSPASITAGNIYHIVVEYASGTISTSRYVALRRSAPLNSLYPFNNATDSNANTLFNSGSGWGTAQGSQPIYELDFAGGTYEGNPYETNTQVNIFGGNWIGERFTVTGGNKTVNSISFYIRQNSATEPLDSLQVELRTVTPNSVVSGGSGILATAAQTNTTYNYFTYTFTSPITLTDGTSYRIILKSPSSNSTNYYQVYRIVTTNAANYNSITYDGTNSIYTVSSNSGSSWTDTNVNWDIGGFKFTISGSTTYATNGTFESHSTGSFDAGATAAFNNITWTPTVPGGTTLQLQVAISASPSGPWDYFGSDGALGTYFTSPASIPLNRINGRYIRYKATFTSDSTNTPTLNDVSINYSP